MMMTLTDMVSELAVRGKGSGKSQEANMVYLGAEYVLTVVHAVVKKRNISRDMHPTHANDTGQK